MEFLELHGVSTLQAYSTLTSLHLESIVGIDSSPDGPQSREDLEKQGRVDFKYVLRHRLDWNLVDEVFAAVNRKGHLDFTRPLSEWTQTAAKPGTLEHDYWYPGCWLMARGMDPDVLDSFNVGYDPDHEALVFPLYGGMGQLIGVARRKPEPKAPYILSTSKYPTRDDRYIRQEVPRGETLYGWSRRTGGDIHLVEGQGDTLRLRSCGYEAFGRLGSSLTNTQLSLVLKAATTEDVGVVLWLDHDRAGLEGGLADTTRLLGCKVRVALPPRGNDPGDLDHVAAREVLVHSMSGFDFVARYAHLRANVD